MPLRIAQRRVKDLFQLPIELECGIPHANLHPTKPRFCDRPVTMRGPSMDTAALPSDQAGSDRQHAERFFVNIIWTWLSVGVSFFTGFFLSRYVIRALGEERYGLWALTFAFVESFGLFDLGFRTAVVNFVSRHRARGETDRINQVINTSLVYFIAIGVLIAALTTIFANQAHRLFKISEQYQNDFALLIRLVGLSWALGTIFGV